VDSRSAAFFRRKPEATRATVNFPARAGSHTITQPRRSPREARTREPRPANRGTILARVRAFIATACVLGIACSAKQSEAPPSTSAARNLVIITIDTLRADHVGAYGYQA